MGTVYKEIERKWLIEPPKLFDVKTGERALCEQTYIVDNNDLEIRIRTTRVDQGVMTTQHRSLDIKSKKQNGSITRTEFSLEIEQAAFVDIKELFALSSHEPVVKLRWDIFNEQGIRFEVEQIDMLEEDPIYMMEVELESEDEEVTLPPGITVIEEVTDDPNYYMASIAKRLKEINSVAGNME